MKYIKTYKLFEDTDFKFNNDENNLDSIDLKTAIELNQIDQIELFIELGGDVNTNVYPEFSLLGYALLNMKEEIMELLILNGSDVNFIYHGSNRNSILILSAKNFIRISTIINLIKAGADVWYENSFGENFFDYFESNLEDLWKEFPKLKKEYLLKKDMEKFNI